MAKKKEVATDLREQAEKVATDQGVSVVYANSKGEFFTVKNYALNSEKDKSKVQTFDFGNAAAEVDGTDETDNGDE